VKPRRRRRRREQSSNDDDNSTHGDLDGDSEASLSCPRAARNLTAEAELAIAVVRMAEDIA